MLIRAVEYLAANFNSEEHTYNGAYVDTTIRGTVAAAQLTNDETGYILEWRIPWTLPGRFHFKATVAVP
jgi:hypothetical protein